MRSATLAVKPTRTPCRCWSACLLQQLRDCRNRKECNDSLSTSNSSKEYMLLYHGIAERWKSVHLAQAGTNQKISQTLLLRSQFQLSYISTVSLIFSPASFHLYISQGAVTKPLRIRVKHPFFFLTDSNPNGGYSTCSNRLPSLPHFNTQTHKARTEWLKAGYLF